MSLTDQKIRAAHASISEAIQKDLFEQGYEWRTVGKETQYTYAPFLYASEEGVISYGCDADSFDAHDFPEVVYTTENKLVVVKKDPVRAKVVLFGKTYFKDELDAALATLKVAI